MDGRMSVSILLVFVWCLIIDAGGFLMVVNAEPVVLQVFIGKIPGVSRIIKEGDDVNLRCVATNLQSNHTVVWSTRDPLPTLIGDTGTVNNEKFTLVLSPFGNHQVLDISIRGVLRGDAGDYVCTVYEPIQTGGRVIVTSSSVTLSVFYFPRESFPMCSPAGPVSVDAGTELNMTCTSDSSHGTVKMIINPTVQTTRYTAWTSVINNDTDTVVRTLDLTVTDADNGTEFKCIISSMIYTNIATCKIGPMTVRQKNTSDPETLSASFLIISSTSSSSVRPTTKQQQRPTGPLNSVAGGIAAFLVIVILVYICRKRPSGISHPNSQQSETDIRRPEDSNSNREEEIDAIPIYAKPIRTQTRKAVNETTQQQPDLSVDSTAEQSYDNHAYGSNISDRTSSPSAGGVYETIKPMALVKPFQRSEPETSTPP